MQRGGHVDPFVIAIRALESDISSAQIGTDSLQEGAEWRAGPFADHAPAFDADVPGDLTLRRQFAQPRNCPRFLVGDAPSKHQTITRLVEYRCSVSLVISVVAEIPHHLAFGEGWGKPVAAEQPALDAFVPG